MLEALLVLAALYFAPTLIAMMRGHHNSVAIFILNALFGWTVFAWIVAFVWSLTAVTRPVPAMPTGVPAADPVLRYRVTDVGIRCRAGRGAADRFGVDRG